MRTPNNYDVSKDVDGSSLTVVDDSEFSQFVTGQKEKLSPEMRKKVKMAIKNAGVKLNIFFMAIAQKNANRLARIMGALDNVDREVLQPWRVKTMNPDQLMDLYSELNVEKHRSTKELLELANKFEGNKDLGGMSSVLEEDIVEAVAELPRASKKKIAEFFKKKIMK